LRNCDCLFWNWVVCLDIAILTCAKTSEQAHGVQGCHGAPVEAESINSLLVQAPHCFCTVADCLKLGTQRGHNCTMISLGFFFFFFFLFFSGLTKRRECDVRSQRHWSVHNGRTALLEPAAAYGTTNAQSRCCRMLRRWPMAKQRLGQTQDRGPTRLLDPTTSIPFCASSPQKK
jgi:hypothetical protein